MWSYYGRKYSIVSKYPKPAHNTIVEPFAGTASYSYKYWDRDIILIEKFDKLAMIWKYLKQASSNDILRLPDVDNGEFIGDKYKWMCDEERWLIGFCINNGSNTPKHTAGRMNFNSWNRDKIRIAQDLYKIRHWEIVFGSYEDAENKRATWFIDPPYQFQKLYARNNVDYESLSVWCKSRHGQVIVCENDKADWMDFKPLTITHGQRKKSQEMMWYREF